MGACLISSVQCLGYSKFHTIKAHDEYKYLLIIFIMPLLNRFCGNKSEVIIILNLNVRWIREKL